MKITLEEGDGYLDVDVKRADGTLSEVVRLDLFEATNAYAAIHNEHTDLVLRAEEWCVWLAGKGLVGLSHGTALALAGRMREEVDAFAKKNIGLAWETPDSPAGTGSTAPS